jgi:gluconolactonase
MVSRRSFLVGSTAVAGVALADRAFAQFKTSPRYPDPSVQILDDSFARYKLGLAKIEQLATGFRWSEGPVWFGDGRYLLWSDIPNNRIMKWDEATGAVSEFRKPSNFSNGNTRDRQGRLLTCEHGTRRVTRTEYDGTITVIADKFDGKPLNSPNDIVCKSDGSIWFTDPPFGSLGYYEGYVGKIEQKDTNVYRVDGKTGQIGVTTSEIPRPNGLAFSPDEKKLYVVQSMLPRAIWVFDVTDNGTKLSNKRKFIDPGNGTPDGFRVDVDGNLWCGWGMGEEGMDGVHVFNAAGKLIGQINLPERCANLCFGGTYRNRLFMPASTSLYSVYVNTQGAIGG